jgi:serine O-acetyltransferase
MSIELSYREYLQADWARLAQLTKLDTTFKWSRCFNSRFAPVAIIRSAFCLQRAGNTSLAKLFSAFNLFLFGIEVPSKLLIGPGLILPHTIGTVLGAASIGANATIFHQVTLGAVVADYDYDLSTRPTLGDNVTVTAGAKILGSIHLGNNSVVGANAVVLKDVPLNNLAVGIPAMNKSLKE